MLGYPVAGPDNDLRPGHRRYNFVWYRPASEDSELPRLLTDDSGRTHALSIPPPLIARDVIAAMRADAERVLAPQFNEMVGLCAQPFLQPIYDLEVPRMAFGRVAILGDAAFVARPHVGAGVAKAAEDALALAQALDAGENVEAALNRISSERASAGRRAHHRARAPSRRAMLQADLKTAAERDTSAARQRDRGRTAHGTVPSGRSAPGAMDADRSSVRAQQLSSHCRRRSPPPSSRRADSIRHMADRIVVRHVERIVGAHDDVVGAEHLDQILELVRREHDRVEIDLASDIRSAASADCRRRRSARPRRGRCGPNSRRDSRRRARRGSSASGAAPARRRRSGNAARSWYRADCR